MQKSDFLLFISAGHAALKTAKEAELKQPAVRI
jgi:hypothetical protein